MTGGSKATPRNLREHLTTLDGVDPDDVIMAPDPARSRGLTPTVCFPVGNLAPEGSVIKSTSIDPTLIDDTEHLSPHAAPPASSLRKRPRSHAIKRGLIAQGDVLVLICGGPQGSGMQEIYQVTSALKNLPFCKHVAVFTDARFSGVSTGPASAISRPRPLPVALSAKSAMAITSRSSSTAAAARHR